MLIAANQGVLWQQYLKNYDYGNRTYHTPY